MCATTDTSTKRALASAPRMELLSALIDRGAQSAEDLADAVGIHVNTTRAHLQRLENEGLIRSHSETRASRGRPHRLYALSRGVGGETDVARSKAESAIRLGRMFRSLYADTEMAPEEYRAQLDVLDSFLDRCGFEPVLNVADLEFRLVCPFGELFERMNRRLCAVHLELIRNALSQAEGPIGTCELEPFAEGGECVLRLRGDNDWPGALQSR
jgi:predicted ArsR family transcriptional regulator